MTDFTYPELYGKNGTEPGNPVGNIVNAARGAVCSLYAAAPWALTQTVFGTDPLGVGSATSAFLDNMCGDKPLPAIPPAPLGGLCAIGYNVTTAYSLGGGYVTGVSYAVLGPVGGITYRTTRFGQYEVGFMAGQGAAMQFFSIAGLSANAGDAEKGRLGGQITSITPIVGADNCGLQYPSYPRTPLPPGGYNPIVPYNDRGVQRDLPVKIPPVNIPVGVLVKPTLVVNVGGIRVVFDFRGASILPLNVNINVPLQIGGGNDINPNPNPPDPAPTDGINPIALADRFDRIEDLLKELKDCACPMVGALQVNQIASNAESLRFTPLAATTNRYCAIALTSIPVNAKKQFGNNAPDVVYAGWAWFSSATGYTSERMPIDAQGKIFENKGHFTVFNFTLYKGFRADAFELNVKPKP